MQWRLLGAATGAASQLAVGALLARLIAPSDFGVLALAFLVLGLTRLLGDLGIAYAIVQRAVLTDRHVRTAFTFSVLLGLAVGTVVAVAAPLGAVVMREPRVSPVLRVLSIGFVFQGASTVAGVLLRRRLDFRRQFFIESTSYVVGYGGVAISLALLGYGVWSLVWGGIVQALLATCAQLAAVRHSMRPLLARAELWELLHFGLGSQAIGCVNYLAVNGDNFVVGRWMGAENLGLYNRAYALMTLPYTYAATVMTSVMFPAFAQVQGDPARLRRGYLMMTHLTAMIAGPSMATMAIAAPHLLPTLYGPRWSGAIAPLQILCFVGYFRALYHLAGVVVQSVGWVYSELWRQCVYATLVIGGALVGSRFGLPGVAAGVSLAILYMFVAMGRLALRASATRWPLYLGAQLHGLLTMGVTCSVGLGIRSVLEAHQVGSVVITLAILLGAAGPWSVAVLWDLGRPEFEPLRTRLPRFFARLIAVVRLGPGGP